MQADDCSTQFPHGQYTLHVHAKLTYDTILSRLKLLNNSNPNTNLNQKTNSEN